MTSKPSNDQEPAAPLEPIVRHFRSCKRMLDFMRFVLTRDSETKRRCMFVGGVDDVVNETCLELSRRHWDHLPAAATTCVANQARWTLARMCQRRLKSVVTPRDLERCCAVVFRETIDDAQLKRRGELVEIRVAIKKALRGLTYRERTVIELRYGIGDGYTFTLEEVARIFRVTRERVREVEIKAIAKLGEAHYELWRYV